ncbi:16594_t:CDS:2, partial [Entrophospora sp. SA101]
MQQPEPIMNNVFLVDICIDKIYANDSSPLDIAKLGIKYFIQQYANCGKNIGFKCILATSNKRQCCLKTEFHDSIHTFLEQLELLGPTDPAYYGSGLNIVFELLSLRRIV